ncbi:hypothetical protein GCM10009775_30430 [Microbacterium aoyamense]|uniref:Uncharacterized protein n=1 Tax=Microbacterium aoyamense TaxID=344166 RepID=A0ABN2PXM7_9MICO
MEGVGGIRESAGRDRITDTGTIEEDDAHARIGEQSLHEAREESLGRLGASGKEEDCGAFVSDDLHHAVSLRGTMES